MVFQWTNTHINCHNPSIKLATKAKACKGVGQEESPGVTSHTSKNAKECEGMNPHTPKWTTILGIRISVDSQISKGRLQGAKLIGLKIPLYH
jgi:hypothetical protein